MLGGGATDASLAGPHATALLQFGGAPIAGVGELGMADVFATAHDGVVCEGCGGGRGKCGGDSSGQLAFVGDALVPLGDSAGVLANHCRHQVPLGDGTIEPADATCLTDGIDVGDGGGQQVGGGDGGGGSGTPQRLCDVEIGDQVVANGDIITG